MSYKETRWRLHQPFTRVRETSLPSILLSLTSPFSALHANEDGSVPATFQVIYVVRSKFGRIRYSVKMVYQIGWKPAPSQPKALERGTAKTKLTDVL